MLKRALGLLQAILSHTKEHYRDKSAGSDPSLDAMQRALDSGDLAGAEACFAQAVSSQKLSAELFMVAAIVAETRGNAEEAVSRLERAMELAPAEAQRQLELGLRLEKLRADDLALAAFACAARCKVPFASALSRLGLLQVKYGLLDEGLVHLARVVQLLPDSAAAHNDLGVAYVALGDIGEALTQFDRALELEPDSFDVLMNAGRAASTDWDQVRAQQYFERAIAARPDAGRARLALGLTRLAVGDREGGGEILQHVGGDDSYSEELNLGFALVARDQVEEGWAVIERARELAPERHEAYVALAFLAFNHGQMKEADRLYQRALELNPNDPNAEVGYGATLLALGDFGRGWEKLEKRFEKSHVLRRLRDRFPADAAWDGSGIEGKTVFVWAEQGLGDQMQFVRYVPSMAELGAEVIVECDRLLARLFARVKGVATVVSLGEPAPAFDLHCPIGSLPRVMGTRLDTIPARVPYLHADPESVDFWRDRLSDATGLRIGLVWAGNPLANSPVLDRWDRRRSIALKEFAPLWDILGVTFVSLQKGAAREQLADIAETYPMIDYTEELQDLADTAGLIANLDLVISVDTSVVHLAGGMGKPVWVLSRLGGDWRWLLDRSDSPWYPTARIFRQQTPANWNSVIDELKEQLAAFSAQNGQKKA